MTGNSNRNNNNEEKELVYGVHSVIELLKSSTADQRVNKVLVQKGLSSEHIAEAIKLAKRDRLIIQEVPKNKLDDISEGGNHQGMAAYKIGRASCRERGKNTLRSAECRSTSERTTVSD